MTDAGPQRKAADHTADADPSSAAQTPQAEERSDAPTPDSPADSAPTDDSPADAAESEEPDVAVLAEADPRSREELFAALLNAENERDEYLDDLRRSHAEFENFRKRMTREGVSQRDVGKAAVVESLLDVLDDLDRTLAAAEGSADETLAKGVELVASKVASTLQGVGVRRIDEVAVAFDPSVHEAVQQQPADEPVEEPRVVQVFRPGYAIGEKTLRAAMVVVEQ